MSTLLFVPYEKANESGLKLVAEVDGADRPELALDALLDENPRLKYTQYVAIVGSLEEGTVVVLEVDPEAEPINPRRNIAVSSSVESKPTTRKSPVTPKRKPRKTAEEPAEESVEEAPKPARKRPARKPAAKRKPATKRAPAKKGGSSPFKKSAKADD